jgi:uncharacterized protein (TIGR02001 family)
MKKLVQALVLTGLVGIPTFVMAAEESPHSLSANVGFTNDYRFRGISQTFEDPAIQGGFDYSHKSGVYLGTWASNVDPDFLAGSNMEWDVYGGYTFDAGPVAVNVGGLYYYYPGKDKAAAGFDPNTFEVYAGATWKMINVKYSHSTTKLFGIADSSGSGYLEANVSMPLPYDVSLGLHYGKQFVSGSGNTDYSDWKIGVSKEILGLNVGLAYVDTNIGSSNATWGSTTSYNNGGSDTKNLADGTVLLSVSKSF